MADLELLIVDDDEIQLSRAPDGGVDITIIKPMEQDHLGRGLETTVRLTADQAAIVLTYLWEGDDVHINGGRRIL